MPEISSFKEEEEKEGEEKVMADRIMLDFNYSDGELLRNYDDRPGMGVGEVGMLIGQ